MSTVGVRNIQVCHADLSGVSAALAHRISNSERLRAAICYWTLAPDALSAYLADRLSGNGFLCVDLHLPTQLQPLRQLSCAGANVFLHLDEASPEVPALPKLPNTLMHAKTLLFDIDEDSAELWVGSHNATARAYGGLNIEASLVITLERRAPLYLQAESFLEAVRARCHPFDLALMDWYDWLQRDRDEHTQAALHLVIEIPGNFTGETLTLFGDDAVALKAFPKTGERLLVSLIDGRTSRQSLYVSQVIDQGLLPGANSNSGGLTFASRMHVFHFGGARPVVVGPAVPDPGRVQAASYFVTLEIRRPEPPGTRTVDPIRSPRFVPAGSDDQRREVDEWFYRVERLRRDATLVSVPNPVVARQRQGHDERVFQDNNVAPVRRVVVRRPGDEE